jgi:hypothetical protein
MPYSSTPCGRVTPEMALRPFQGWPAHRVGNLRPSFTLLDTSCRTPRRIIDASHRRPCSASIFFIIVLGAVSNTTATTRSELKINGLAINQSALLLHSATRRSIDPRRKWDEDIGVGPGVSKRVKDGHRPPAVRAGHP